MPPFEHDAVHVGDYIPSLAIQRDGFTVNFVGGKFHIVTLVYSPPNTLKEMAKVSANGIQLGLSAFQDLLMLTAKLGSLPWQDASYSPHLQKETDLPKATPIPTGEGLAALHLLVDSADGRILHIDRFVLPNHFSNYLVSAVHQLKQRAFDPEAHCRRVADIQSRYSPRELNKLPGTERFHYSPQHK